MRTGFVAGLFLLAVGLYTSAACGFANEPPPDSAVSIAPVVNGFNDPNAIRYDAGSQTRLENLQDEWEPNALENRAGVEATVVISGEFGKAEKYAYIHDARFVPLGRRFLDLQLVTFLQRRADGDLRQTDPALLRRDICTAISLCAQAEVGLSLPAMKKLLDDPDKEIRSAAYEEIPCVGAKDEELFRRLSKDLEDAKKAVWIAANFYRFGERGLPLLARTAERTADPYIIDAIARYPQSDEPTIAVLIALLKKDDWQIQTSASFTLAKFGSQARSAIPAMIELHARAKGGDVGYAALAQMGDEARQAMMEDAKLSAQNYRDAMEALWNGQPYAAGVPLLITGLHHPDAGVRKQAAYGLHGDEAIPAVPELVKLLNDPDAQVRSQAAQSLGYIGGGAAPAIPALKAVLKTNDEAVEAIRNIELDLKRFPNRYVHSRPGGI